MLHLSGVPERIADDLNTRKVNAFCDLLWNERERIAERIVTAEALQQNEHQYIDADENVIDERRYRPVCIVVTDWEHKYLLGIRRQVSGDVTRYPRPRGSAVARSPRCGLRMSRRSG